MSRVYRVLRREFARDSFDGEGAYRYGGRWSSPGTRLTYTSEHQSLAMLEYFVHLDKDDPPDDLVLAVAEVPDDLRRECVESSRLPRNWRQASAPRELTQLGNEFVRKRKHCLLLVPSVMVTSEYNWLLNPNHPDFKQISIHELEPLSYDPRMFSKERRGHRHRIH